LPLNGNPRDEGDDGEWNGPCFKCVFVDDRAVQPDNVLPVVLDLGAVGMVRLDRMRVEVTVRDPVMVVRPRFVDVLGCERGREQEIWPGHNERSGASQGTSHDCIIRGCGVRVNELAVNSRSKTGQ